MTETSRFILAFVMCLIGAIVLCLSSVGMAVWTPGLIARMVGVVAFGAAALVFEVLALRSERRTLDPVIEQLRLATERALHSDPDRW